MKIDHLLTVGSVDKDLRVTYLYEYRDGEFKTIHEYNGKWFIEPNYAIKISRSYDDSIFVPRVRYFHFVSLLEKSVKLISENLYNLFPDVDRVEFEIDQLELKRFQTEKAMSISGMKMTPCVWVNKTNECFAGIHYEDPRTSFKFPLEDAIAFVRMFSTFDPNLFGLAILRILGKIE